MADRIQRQRFRPAAKRLLGYACLLPAALLVGTWEAQADVFRDIIRSKDAGYLTEWGERYEKGKSVAKNADRAVRLYCRAARLGNAEAKYRLGELYDNGEGRLPPDERLSAAWLYQAAQGGHPQAIERIGELGIDHKPGRHPSCILSDGRFAEYNFKPHPARGRVAKLVRRLAPKYKLDPNLVLAVIEVESAFDVRALSPKNAQGLMQLIPETASRFGVRNVWDAEQNIRGGMAYLRWLLKNFSGDVRLALAAYNAGERAVERHGGIPPYEETRSYVKRILRRLQP
jgi:TPR repeat protein